MLRYNLLEKTSTERNEDRKKGEQVSKKFICIPWVWDLPQEWLDLLLLLLEPRKYLQREPHWGSRGRPTKKEAYTTLKTLNSRKPNESRTGKQDNHTRTHNSEKRHVY